LNDGKIFEQDFRKSIPDSCYSLRLNDPAQSFNKANDGLRFSLHNPYDTILFDGKKLYCFELKTSLNSLTFWKPEYEYKEKHQSINNKSNQIIGLTNASKFENIIAGFIINFRSDINKTYFVSIDEFNKLINSISKKSFNCADVEKYTSAILIEQQIKKVHYKYDDGKLLKQLSDK
jgi:recombination protein U